jgi:hypothetical protein
MNGNVPELLSEAIDICSICRAGGIQVNIFGGVAAAIVGASWFSRHPEYRRKSKDIDLVGHRMTMDRLRSVLQERGYREERHVAIETEAQRALFLGPVAIIDFSSDVLRFAQELAVIDRLGLSFPTLSPTDLILEKLQIVSPKPPQIIDFIALLCGDRPQRVDGVRLEEVLGNQWPYWHSACLFLSEAREHARRQKLFDEVAAMDEFVEMITRLPKTFRWKVRSSFGEYLPWHSTVEPISAG